jgi:hypothetical protein
VLGLFACHHIVNDRTEEQLAADGLTNSNDPDDKRSNRVLYGQPAPLPTDPPDVAARTTAGLNPPTTAEMSRVALQILSRARGVRRSPTCW